MTTSKPDTYRSKILLAVVFLNGFVLMTFEITGSRVLAPFMGSSTHVWASIIGVILLSMSLGYAYGGQQADKKHSLRQLGINLFLAGLSLLVVNLAKNALLNIMGQMDMPLILKSTLASGLLFAVPSFYMATVLPFVVSLVLKSVQQTGAIVGRYYAFSTIGSILGTYAGAVFFVPLIGTTHTLWVLGGLLMVCSWICFRIKGFDKFLLIGFLLGGNIGYAYRYKEYTDVDTSYNRVWIVEGTEADRPVRYMMLNGHVNSGCYLDQPDAELLIEYTQYYQLIEHFVPDFEQVLMIGGGAFSFPKYYQHHYPGKSMDVVEIDGDLEGLSQMYFGFKKGEHTRVFHEDARTFLVRDSSRYDAILNDVFSSQFNVPFQLTTEEAYSLVKKRLSTHGVLLINALASNFENRSAYLHSQVKTLKAVFNHVAVLAVQKEAFNGKKNFMLVASDTPLSFTSSDAVLSAMLSDKEDTRNEREGIVMTDDYAPVNWLLSQ